MSLELKIMLALVLDSLAGYPRWRLHPVRLIGRLAARCETVCRSAVRGEQAAGIVAVLVVLTITAAAAWGVLSLSYALHPWAGEAVSLLLLYSTFAARDLMDHSSRVHAALERGDLPAARGSVGMIVGRDTASLDRDGVVRACVESVAENTVDGITGPLFWAIVGGPLGAVMYRAVSTMDAMFGHSSRKYLLFGRAAARLDDAVNFLPARLTGLGMVLAAVILRQRWADSWRIFRRDRLKHARPSAGHAEAAVAGALGIRLGGNSVYGGKVMKKPFIGDPVVEPDPGHIQEASRIMIAVTSLFFVCMLLLRSLFFLLTGAPW